MVLPGRVDAGDGADGRTDGVDGRVGGLVRTRVSGLARAAAHHTGRRVRAWVSPRVEDEVVPGEGEFVIDEVAHHWVLAVPRALEVAGAVGLFVLSAVPPWPPVVALPGVVLLGHAAWRALADHRDRFVITNLRVLRVQGVISRRTATMPIQRILDITVTVPVLGRVLGYGHFVFESAAQSQGLRDVRYIGDPHQRDLLLQRVIQRSGLRRGIDRYRREDLPDPGLPHGRRATDPEQLPDDPDQDPEGGGRRRAGPDPHHEDPYRRDPHRLDPYRLDPYRHDPQQPATQHPGPPDRAPVQRSSRRRRVGFHD